MFSVIPDRVQTGQCCVATFLACGRIDFERVSIELREHTVESNFFHMISKQVHALGVADVRLA